MMNMPLRLLKSLLRLTPYILVNTTLRYYYQMVILIQVILSYQCESVTVAIEFP